MKFYFARIFLYYELHELVYLFLVLAHKIFFVWGGESRKKGFRIKGEGDTDFTDESNFFSDKCITQTLSGQLDSEQKAAKKQLPVTILGRYAKVLMSSHEFLFVR